MLFPFSFMQSQVTTDPDALAFFARVTAAGGTLSPTEKTAVNTLVLDMKSYGLWTSMKAIYPMVGASAAACAQNLKSSSFTGTFTSGWTFASGGIQGNGTSSYMDTGLPPNGNFTQGSSGLTSYRNITATFPSSNTRNDIGAAAAAPYLPLLYLAGNTRTNKFEAGSYSYNLSEGQLNFTQTQGTGFFQAHRTSTTLNKAYIGGTLTSTNTNSNTAYTPNITSNLYVGASNLNGIAADFNDARLAFISAGDGLTDTQASNFYTAVQTFNQTLNRQVGAQIVSDADAQAYINRVYTAGGTLTNTEANAVNQLTIDMKAAGIWTAMKAVYPMVGSSAASCAQNLKSSSFTGTFTSGWTFASTGATPNGTSAYMDTGLNTSTDLTLSTNHYSYYSRTSSVVAVTVEMGVFQTAFVHLRTAVNYVAGGVSSLASFTTTLTSAGFWLGSKTANNSRKAIYNGSVQATNTTTDTTSYPNLQVYIGARNDGGSAAVFSDKQCAFASIGDGLTDTQASNFYTAVQAFQTTLSRNV